MGCLTTAPSTHHHSTLFASSKYSSSRGGLTHTSKSKTSRKMRSDNVLCLLWQAPARLRLNGCRARRCPAPQASYSGSSGYEHVWVIGILAAASPGRFSTAHTLEPEPYLRLKPSTNPQRLTIVLSSVFLLCLLLSLSLQVVLLFCFVCSCSCSCICHLLLLPPLQSAITRLPFFYQLPLRVAWRHGSRCSAAAQRTPKLAPRACRRLKTTALRHGKGISCLHCYTV